MIGLPALVKLMGNKKAFSLPVEYRDKLCIHPKDKTCALVKAGLATKLKDGTDVNLSESIEANTSFLVYPEIPLVTNLYHIMVGYNPALAMNGIQVTVACPIVRPNEEGKVALLLRTTKKTDISDLKHMFEIYLID